MEACMGGVEEKREGKLWLVCKSNFKNEGGGLFLRQRWLVFQGHALVRAEFVQVQDIFSLLLLNFLLQDSVFTLLLPSSGSLVLSGISIMWRTMIPTATYETDVTRILTDAKDTWPAAHKRPSPEKSAFLIPLCNRIEQTTHSTGKELGPLIRIYRWI